MNFRIHAYKLGSKSSKKLSSELGGLRLQKPQTSRYRQRARHTLINWGSSVAHPRVSHYDYNQPSAVRLASCKLQTLNALDNAEVPTLEWTPVRAEAKEWIDEGFKVYARTILSGHSGNGIVVVEPGEDSHPPHAPLYTKGLTEWTECRIHTDKDGLVIDWQMKKRRNGAESSTDVRNHGNDYVFCRNVDPPSEDAFEVAKNAIIALGLDFGAVDMAITPEGPLVIEVNTAPGLEGTTLTNYISYFENGTEHVRS